MSRHMEFPQGLSDKNTLCRWPDLRVLELLSKTLKTTVFDVKATTEKGNSAAFYVKQPIGKRIKTKNAMHISFVKHYVSFK